MYLITQNGCPNCEEAIRDYPGATVLNMDCDLTEEEKVICSTATSEILMQRGVISFPILVDGDKYEVP